MNEKNYYPASAISVISSGLIFALDLRVEQKTWSVGLPFFWVHHLKYGLKKSLNWLKLVPGIKLVRGCF